ncbi:cupin domain-containing protein [Amycolatopsis sp. NBC_01480]|uniref:cupin domain-containing protein n=1 Tax=Amycolatopsis sp. NBC_01480 TaxID=2903562 RepID=UPI002E2E8239|nr:cupin domain-containing protein [Amycolatopsis sp. NBC_01480]
MESDNTESVFDVFAELAQLPETAETMLVDKYFVDKPSASARIFRIYRELPLHYHTECDEHLYVVSGRGTFHLDGQEYEARPGMFLSFAKTKVHGFPRITEHPLVVLSVDVPRRRPDDIVFVDPEQGDAASFMARNNPR